MTHPTEAELPKQPEITRSYLDLTVDLNPIQVGERVFCTVSAIRCWMTVTEVKGKGSSLRIKTDGFKGWGYGHNFTRKPAEWMTRR